MVRTGQNRAALIDDYMQNLKSENIQVDEIWCYVRKKQRQVTITDKLNEVGDKRVFVALDADSKLIHPVLVSIPKAPPTTSA